MSGVASAVPVAPANSTEQGIDPVTPAFRTLQIGMGWFPESPGGLDRVYFNLARALPAAGVAFDGCVVGSDAVGHETGGRVVALAPATAGLPSRLWRARHCVARLVAERHPDLIASHFPLFAFPALDLIARLPFIVHFHGPWSRESAVEGGKAAATAIKHAIERAVYRQADRIIVLSRAFRRELIEHYHIPSHRIRIVPGGVEVDAFARQPSREEARRRLGWPVDRPIILAVRRLARRMGLDDLIDAMRLVRAKQPDAVLMIVGGGPIAAELAARIEGSGLGSCVHLYGRCADAMLPLAYRAADLSVVPSVALEGFGLVVAESLAAGTPALVTPVGGLPEVVRALSPDLVLPETGAPALAEGIIGALDGGIALPGAQSCEDYARRHFDWPVVASAIRNIYRDVM